MDAALDPPTGAPSPGGERDEVGSTIRRHDFPGDQPELLEMVDVVDESVPAVPEPRDEYRAAIWAVPNLGLHCFDDGSRERFDARRPGLDHLALRCADRETLERWRDHVDSLGYQRGEILDEPYGAGLAVFDPDGIAIELFVPRPRTIAR